MESFGESLDSVLMGDGSEKVSLSPAERAQRTAAVQAKLKALAKKEQKTKRYDAALANMLGDLKAEEVEMVAQLVSLTVPSLTIIAMLSVRAEPASALCEEVLARFVQEWASMEGVKGPASKERIARWWTFVILANQVSRTTKLDQAEWSRDDLRQMCQKMVHWDASWEGYDAREAEYMAYVWPDNVKEQTHI